eukprot:Skav223002  [mRNA]  locus=scaffold1827:514196:516413:- [translate_table: standard]
MLGVISDTLIEPKPRPQAIVSYRAFANDFEWETLPWEERTGQTFGGSGKLLEAWALEIAQDEEGKDFQPEDSGETYTQPELVDELPETVVSESPKTRKGD